MPCRPANVIDLSEKCGFQCIFRHVVIVDAEPEALAPHDRTGTNLRALTLSAPFRDCRRCERYLDYRARALFRPQRLHRIDRCRPARGDKGRRRGADQKQNGNRRGDRPIYSVHSVKKVLHQSARQHAGSPARDQTDRNRYGGLGHR